MICYGVLLFENYKAEISVFFVCLKMIVLNHVTTK